MKRIFFFSLLFLAAYSDLNAQSIEHRVISSAGGQLSNGNIHLSFTIGEPIIGQQSAGNVHIGKGFWSIVPATYISNASLVYRFIGNGNFTDVANWQNGMLPPNPLPSGAEIIIDNIVGGQCILNISLTVNPNAKVSVLTGRRLTILGNLIVN